MARKYLTARQAASLLHYTIQHVAYLCRQGKLDGAEKRIEANGAAWYIPAGTVRKAMKGRKKAAINAAQARSGSHR